MIVDECDHGVLDGGLLGVHAGVHVLVQLLAQSLDDELAVWDLLAVELDEGELAALGAELVVVVYVLEEKEKK